MFAARTPSIKVNSLASFNILQNKNYQYFNRNIMNTTVGSKVDRPSLPINSSTSFSMEAMQFFYVMYSGKESKENKRNIPQTYNQAPVEGQVEQPAKPHFPWDMR